MQQEVCAVNVLGFHDFGNMLSIGCRRRSSRFPGKPSKPLLVVRDIDEDEDWRVVRVLAQKLRDFR